MTTIADLIGEKLESELRDAAKPVRQAEPPARRVVVVKARPLAPRPRGRGWRRASGKLK